MEYAMQCMSMRSGNARYSADPCVVARHRYARFLDVSQVSWHMYAADLLAITIQSTDRFGHVVRIGGDSGSLDVRKSLLVRPSALCAAK
jgi:hypothetical protein